MLDVVRAVGIGRLVRLYRAYRWGWQDIISGFYTTRILQALFNVGFFDEILAQGHVDVTTFAREKALDEHILQSLCDSLYALRILDRNGIGYKLTGKGNTLAAVARGWFDGIDGYRDLFHSLEAMLRGEVVYGRDVDRRLLPVSEGTAAISSWLQFPMALQQLQQLGCQTVLDLGCGDGGFLTYLYQQGGIDGYGVDLSEGVIESGRHKLERMALDRHIHLFAADARNLAPFRDKLPALDAATAMFMLHEVLYEGSDGVVELLRKFRDCYPGVPLLVYEVDCPSQLEMRRRPGMMVQYKVQHDLSNQCLVSREAWIQLFDRAGYQLINEVSVRAARVSAFTLV